LPGPAGPGVRADREPARGVGGARGLGRRYPPLPGALPGAELCEPAGATGGCRGRPDRRRDRGRRLAGPGDGRLRPMSEPVFPEHVYQRAKEIISRYPPGRERSALLPLLHLVQAEEGYVSPAGIGFCAELLNLTRAQVAAVATFYTMYKRAPAGDWLISVCTNTMCGVLGGDAVFDAMKQELGVGHDQT